MFLVSSPICLLNCIFIAVIGVVNLPECVCYKLYDAIYKHTCLSQQKMIHKIILQIYPDKSTFKSVDQYNSKDIRPHPG
jgi:hypothetical protein